MDEIGRLVSEWQIARRKEKKRLKEKLLRKIWEYYHPRLRVFLASIPRENREDRVSDILLKVFESLESYNGDYAFSTWIYRIARNSEIDRFRQHKLDTVEWDETVHTPEEQGETPEKIVLRKEDRRDLNRAIRSLKSTEQELLYLAYFEELPYREISRILGRPEGTVKYEMHRIRKILKGKLEKEMSHETK
jgi:RNA polymerase sigma factor (sigma-70 family)